MKQYSAHFSPNGSFDDGVLLDDFSFPWRNEPCPRTEFVAVWDSDSLHFRFEVEDTDLVLYEGQDHDESVLGSDRVELFFAADQKLESPYFGIEMDPRGWVYDYRAQYYRQFDPAWSFPGLGLVGSVRESGYEVRGSLPLESLRTLSCLRENRIFCGVYRAEFFHGETGIDQDWISWVDPGGEKPDFHVPESFGVIELISPLDS